MDRKKKVEFKSLHYEISWGCNISCPMCTFHDEKHQNEVAALENVFSLTEGLSLFGHVHIGDGSEPFINHKWYEIISFFKSKGKEVSLQTNAKYIRSLEVAKKIVLSGLDRISISIDGIDDNTISRIRKGITFQEILSAIDYMNQAKKELNSNTPILESNIVAMHSNINQLKSLVNLLINKNFKKVRIGFLELRQVNQELMNELLIYEKEKTLSLIQEIKDDVNKQGNPIILDTEIFDLTKNSETRNNCPAYYERIYLRQDGNLYACYGKAHLGNAYETSLLECLQSKKYYDYVKVIESSNNHICSSCSFCRIMTFDDIGSHFGNAVIQEIGMEVLEDSLTYVKNNGTAEEYWNNYFQDIRKTNVKN